MSNAALTPGERRRSLAAVIASMAVLSLIHGLTMPLLAIVLEGRGVGKSLIGLSTATQSLAVLAVAPFVPGLIARFGLVRLMIASTVLSVAVFLLLPVFDNVYAWFPLRFVLGVGGSILWIGGEAWINQIVEDRIRGRIVALYTAALSGGMAVGPFILAQTGSEGWPPFLAAAALIVASAVPLVLAVNTSPVMGGRASARLPFFLFLAPTAMLLNGVFAAADMAMVTFLPIYTLSIGVDEASSLYLLTLMGLGGLAFQLPFGWLADHVDRRLLVIGCVLLLVAGVAAMPFVVALKPWGMIYVFAFGGVFTALYALALVLLGERFQGVDLVSASAVFSVMWGLGSIVGPPIGGVGMDLWQPHGLPIVIGLMFLAFLPFPVIDYLRRRRVGNA